MSSSKITFWVWKCWLRLFLSRIWQAGTILGLLVFFLVPVLLFTLFNVALRLPTLRAYFIEAEIWRWIPTFGQLLWLEFLLTCSLIVLFIFMSAPGSMLRFTRNLDGRLGWGDRLATWVNLRKQKTTSNVGKLFLQDLQKDLQVVDVRSFLPAIPLRWRPYAFVGVIVLHLLWYFLPNNQLPYWGEDGQAIVKMVQQAREENQGDSDSQTEIMDRAPQNLQNSRTTAEEPESPNSTAPSDTSSTPAEEQKIELQPKYVPAIPQAGPTTLKDIFVYDLEVKPSKRSVIEKKISFAQNYAQLREVAEEAIRREPLADEEKRFVMQYFDRIRP